MNESRVVVERDPKKKPDHIDALENASIFPLIFRLSFAAVMSEIAQMIYEMFDSAFISIYNGESVLGGVSAFLFLESLISIQIGISVGISVAAVISHALGEGNMMRAKKALLYFIVFGCLWTIAIPAIFIPLLPRILPLVGVEEFVMAETREYAIVVVAGSGFTYFVCGFSAILKAENLAITSMFITVIPAVLNFIGDPLLMRVLDLGVFGAGISTVVANFIGILVTIFLYVRSNSPIAIRLSKDVIKAPTDKDVLKTIASLAIPNYIFNCNINIGGILASNNISRYSDSDTQTMQWIAIYGSAARIGNMVFRPCKGISNSIPTILGFNIGAKNWKRSWESIWKSFISIALFSWFLAGLINVFSREIASLLSSTSTMEDTLTYISRITTIPMFFSALYMTTFGIFQSERSSFFQIYTAIIGWFGMITSIFLIPHLVGSVDGFRYVLLSVHSINITGAVILAPWKIKKYIKLKNDEEKKEEEEVEQKV
ncbi:Multi antimicrobial extrusion protein like protein [Aduncisulcus paluster]|uniref:Multi antimicrobial extrusion protein like protein n=1 Tax=Aduncisulcus paluster TaxID=2918883 RepID=A0ABQ5K1R0_9EUKA|nr:Multi antimicrobial extrusion protein like protein [Aduncisulcus paluster]